MMNNTLISVLPVAMCLRLARNIVSSYRYPENIFISCLQATAPSHSCSSIFNFRGVFGARFGITIHSIVCMLFFNAPKLVFIP